MLTCSGHWLWFSERHNTLIYLVLIYIPRPPCSHAAENISVHAGDPVQRMQPTPNCSQKAFILRFPAMTPTSTRLFIHIIYSTFSKRSVHSTQSCRNPTPRWKTVFYRRWHGDKLMCRNTVNYFKLFFWRQQQLAAGWSLKFNSCRGDCGERSCPRGATAFHSVARSRITNLPDLERKFWITTELKQPKWVYGQYKVVVNTTPCKTAQGFSLIS